MNKEELEKKKADLLRELDEEPPYDKEAFEAKMKTTKGTIWEWAQMQDDGVIATHTSMYDLDGSHGTGGFTVAPDDDDYEKAKQQYGLSKPGDTYHVRKIWADGKWVIQQDDQDQTNQAKSA